jgi:hypothetical protein
MRWARALTTQGYGSFPVTAAWQVKIDPKSFTLTPNQQIHVNVEIEYLPGNFTGQQAFNINAFATSPHTDRELVGGVTLIVTE